MIRPARPQDVPQIHRLIRELADCEHSLSEVTATEDDLRRALFADQPAVFAHVAEHEGAVAGFAESPASHAPDEPVPRGHRGRDAC
jgi:N-acetylglutamate synthase-like GNAT family acetyltransferase